MDNTQKIIAIVKQFSNKTGIPEPDESLFESGYLDSFALPDMVSDLEKEFQIKIPDSDLSPRKFESIARIVGYIEGRASA